MKYYLHVNKISAINFKNTSAQRSAKKTETFSNRFDF